MTAPCPACAAAEERAHALANRLTAKALECGELRESRETWKAIAEGLEARLRELEGEVER